MRGCGGAHGEYILHKLNQIFQSMVLNNQDLDKGLMNTDVNHCSELHLGRLSFVGEKGGEGEVGLMENILQYVKSNFKCFVSKNQEMDMGLMNTDANHCGDSFSCTLGGRLLLLLGRGARVWWGSMAVSGIMERRERVVLLLLRLTLDRQLELPPITNHQNQSINHTIG